MTQPMKELYEFGRFTLDVRENRLLRDGQSIPLKPKVLETLVVLVANTGRTLDKEELMKRLWPDSYVEEANLAVNISQLRKALGENENGESYIETVPKRGYRFVAPVTKVLADQVDMVVRERRRARVVIEEEETSNEKTIEQSGEAARLAPIVVSNRTLSRKKLLLAVTSLILVVGTASFLGLSRLSSRKTLWPWRSPAGANLQPTLTKLTNLGRVSLAVISPNGQYAAYVVKDGRTQSLHALHLATSQSMEVKAPAEQNYWAINFTPDSSYIDYKPSPDSALYRVALFGGPSIKVIDDIGSGPAYSPDGRHLAFVHFFEGKEARVIVTNADGTERKTISTLTDADAGSFAYAPGSLAWSPDGKAIAALAVSFKPGERGFQPVTINVADGVRREITSKRWPWIRGLSWANDGHSILMAASEEDYDSCQIWRLSYPGGELERVTNDVSGYSQLSSTADSSKVVTVRTAPIATIWIAPYGDAAGAIQLSSHTTDGMWGVCWTPDGRIVYSSKEGGRFDIWIMNSDGTGRKQLTANKGSNMLPIVTPDGQWIVFTSNRSGVWSLWRTTLNGDNPTQLANTGSGFTYKSSSADSRWVVYAEGSVLRAPIEGGEPVKLTDPATMGWYSYLRTSASPDGKWIALTYVPNPPKVAAPRLGIIPFEGGDLVKTFDLPSDVTYEGLLHWTADSKAITYTRQLTGSKIWIQPIDGSPFRELTDFKSDNIWEFGWSADGKQVAVARGGRFGDVVLISNFK